MQLYYYKVIIIIWSFTTSSSIVDIAVVLEDVDDEDEGDKNDRYEYTHLPGCTKKRILLTRVTHIS